MANPRFRTLGPRIGAVGYILRELRRVLGCARLSYRTAHVARSWQIEELEDRTLMSHVAGIDVGALLGITTREKGAMAPWGVVRTGEPTAPVFVLSTKLDRPEDKKSESAGWTKAVDATLTTTGVTVGVVTMGYGIWRLWGAFYLLSSALTATPLWSQNLKQLDPLAVLNFWEKYAKAGGPQRRGRLAENYDADEERLEALLG